MTSGDDSGAGIDGGTDVADGGAADALADTDGSARRSDPSTWIIAALGVVVVVLAVIGLVLVLTLPDTSTKRDANAALNAKRSAAVSAASTEIQTLLTVNGTNAKAQLAKLLAGARAGFRSQVQSTAQTFQQQLTKNHVDAKGSILSAGLVSLSRSGGYDTATVVLAARASVSYASSAPQQRNYRLTVTVQLVNGAWLVSGIEFVV